MVIEMAALPARKNVDPGHFLSTRARVARLELLVEAALCSLFPVFHWVEVAWVGAVGALHFSPSPKTPNFANIFLVAFLGVPGMVACDWQGEKKYFGRTQMQNLQSDQNADSNEPTEGGVKKSSRRHRTQPWKWMGLAGRTAKCAWGTLGVELLHDPSHWCCACMHASRARRQK